MSYRNKKTLAFTRVFLFKLPSSAQNPTESDAMRIESWEVSTIRLLWAELPPHGMLLDMSLKWTNLSLHPLKIKKHRRMLRHPITVVTATSFVLTMEPVMNALTNALTRSPIPIFLVLDETKQANPMAVATARILPHIGIVPPIGTRVSIVRPRMTTPAAIIRM